MVKFFLSSGEGDATAQNDWVSGLCPLSGILKRDNLNHWTTHVILATPKGTTRVGVSLPSPEDGNSSSFGNLVLFSF
jgi:hypothetical protein